MGAERSAEDSRPAAGLPGLRAAREAKFLTQQELAKMQGVSPSRTHQIVPGALVAEAAMDIFDLDELEICPWALREGVILERLDQISVLGRR